MRFLRQSVPEALALCLLLCVTQLQVMVSHFARAVMDPDFFWHVRVGDWILTAHRFPVTGIFSQHAARGWVAYSWGFEVPLALAARAFGLAALPISLALFRALLLFVLFAVLLRLSGRFWISWLLTAVASLPLSDVMVLRPVMFTMLFFTIELGLLLEARRTGSIRSLYALPVLFVFWANTHIQFVYGLFVFTVFVACELISEATGRWNERTEDSPEQPSRATAAVRAFLAQRGTDSPLIRLFTIYLATLLATVIGPYWGRAYVTVFHYVSWVQQYNEISEFISLSFRGPQDYCVLLLLIGACLAAGRKRLDLFSVLLLTIVAIVSFRSRRDEWFITITACMFIAESVAELAISQRRRFFPRAGHIVALGLSCAAALGYAADVGLTQPNLMPNIEATFPVRASLFVTHEHLQGPMYNTFNWGGFLIYNLRGYPVSIDGRYDLYGPELFERASKTLNAIDWQNDPDFKAANFALLERDLPLVAALAVDPNYKLVYSDPIAVVFVRNRAEQPNPPPQKP